MQNSSRVRNIVFLLPRNSVKIEPNNAPKIPPMPVLATTHELSSSVKWIVEIVEFLSENFTKLGDAQPK